MYIIILCTYYLEVEISHNQSVKYNNKYQFEINTLIKSKNSLYIRLQTNMNQVHTYIFYKILYWI